MLKINEEIEKKKWNEFIIENEGSFLQSFEWGEFQKSLGQKVWRVMVQEEGKIKATIQIIKEFFPLKGKCFFYVPFGPTFRKSLASKEKEEIIRFVLGETKRLAEKEGVIFLRIEPLAPLPAGIGLPASKRIQARQTLILDLKKEEEEIFQNFRKGTRYSIKFAQKNNVKFEYHEEYLPVFYRLLGKTAKRNKFSCFKEKHYKNLFDFSSNDFKVELWLAKYNEKVIVVNILVFFQKRCFYLHAGSDKELSRDYKASDFLQWQQIKEAKKRGYEKYNFWGIDEKKWPGVTFFKKGFGGEEFIYPEGRDVVFQNFWYRIYKLLRKIKKCF